MADSLTIEITGVNELRDKIVALAQSVEANKVEPLLLTGAKTVRDTAISHAPVGPTGNLKKAIIAKMLKPFGMGKIASALAGVDRKKAPHAYLVEFGSPGRYGKKGSYKGRYFGPMPAQPFMRPAWDSTKDRVLGRIVDGLKKLIEESVKK
jgi:HK97 gp10 family phage protein